jgi:hypothetical protein
MPPTLDGNEFRMREEFLYACCIFVGYSVVRSALKGMLGVCQLGYVRSLTHMSKTLRFDTPNFSYDSCRPRMGPSLREDAIAAL